MRRRHFLKLLGSATIGSSILIGHQFDGSAQTVANLDAILEPIRAQHGVPALTAAFVRGDDLVALGAVGRRAKTFATEVTSNDLWHLGSCTKSMTATMFGTLVEKGVLSWETTLAEVFGDQFNFLEDYADLSPVELFSHRTGLPGVDHPEQYNPLQLQLLDDAFSAGGSLQQQRLRFAKDALNAAPISTPGTTYDYNNLGYIIAGAMIETITDDTWENLMQTELFEPLGMVSTNYGPPGQSVISPDQPWAHLGQACTPIPPSPEADNLPLLGPAGTVHSAMEDWAKYASLHLNGFNQQPTPILQTDTFRTLQRDQFRQGYSLGWLVTQRDWAGGTAMLHTGSNNLWMAVIWLAPNRNAGLLAVTNCASDQSFPAIDAAVVAMINRYLV